jgi:hypothetical protein
MKTLHIVIDPKTGKVQYEVEGVLGASCTDITAALTKGHLVEDEQLTEDYFVPGSLPAYTSDG